MDLDKTADGGMCQLEAVKARVMAALDARRWMAATAESCTGGALAQAFTSRSGASRIFSGAIVAYQPDIKQAWLGVETTALEKCGVVSRLTAIEMAAGAARRFNADIAIATTGYAGPGGGDENYPVGTVCFGIFCKHRPFRPAACAHIFEGTRARVISLAVFYGMACLDEYLGAR